MAAYAALVSLMNLIDQIHHHPQPPVILDEEQTQSLTEKIAFLQDFLEAYNRHYSNQEVERLRIHIADAAYAAEDVIESHVVDQLLAKRPDDNGKKKSLVKVKQYFGFIKRYVVDQFLARRDQTSSADLCQSRETAEENIIESTSTHDADKYLYQGVQKVLEEMDSVKKDVEEIKDKLGNQEQLQGIIAPHVVSTKSLSTQNNTIVGFDDVLYELLDKLTGQRDSPRQIIPISGMAGIGKTTLAKYLYTNPLVEHHFHVLAWATISQEYKIKEILLEVLLCQENQESRKSLSQMSEAELGEKLYKSLCGRRYLIVMDDMWSTNVWDKVKFYFPSNNEGSRIIVTTRLTNVASYLSSGCSHEMDFLDEDKSWSLFCKTVFGEEDCPPELEHIGMEIIRNCKGLPLSIVVLGGHLAKSERTQEYWAYILRNLNSIVNLEESERCLKILHTSYEELPVHLKACFLYMGTFLEDSKISVSELISMWVAEGFLKPISVKSFEESGEEYLMDLIDRNLILYSEHGYSEILRFCNMHDLLRDLCIREARKEMFVFFANQHDHEGITTQRRIVIDQNISNKVYLQNLQFASAARSLICYSEKGSPTVERRLLRVLKWPVMFVKGNRRGVDTFQKVNLRYVAIQHHSQCPVFSFAVSLWNLQTLIIQGGKGVVAPCEIWKMPLLRHVECFRLTLPDHPSGDTNESILHNLHTLMGVLHLKFGEEVVKRIPNVKKLEISYELASDYSLNNLRRLHKLECLDCNFPSWDDMPQNFVFPHSLKELRLWRTSLSWDDINTKIGSLPHLRSLQLKSLLAAGFKWQTEQGLFCSLKYLLLSWCRDWEYWSTESTHFPRLEHLVLEGSVSLKEIPRGIGDIPTLKSIQLRRCTHTAIISAKKIADEQEELGNETLRVTLILNELHWRYQQMEPSQNFQVKIIDSDI